jgi:hypothetical protein
MDPPDTPITGVCGNGMSGENLSLFIHGSDEEEHQIT